jgi:ChAPs (Chs5p-Arf1p-binding proteins)
MLGLQRVLPGKFEMDVTGDCFLVGGLDLILKLGHSCFNAFSRVDIRVDVKIPGGVNAYVIDLRGERYGIDQHVFCVFLFYSAGTMLPRRCGRKLIFRLFYVRFCIRMIQRIGWNVIGN